MFTLVIQSFISRFSFCSFKDYSVVHLKIVIPRSKMSIDRLRCYLVVVAYM